MALPVVAMPSGESRVRFGSRRVCQRAGRYAIDLGKYDEPEALAALIDVGSDPATPDLSFGRAVRRLRKSGCAR